RCSVIPNQMAQSFRYALLNLICSNDNHADTITGTIKDPTGAVISGAHIEISGKDLPKPLAIESDEAGIFNAPNLAAGKYSIHVSRDGFNEIVTNIELKGTAELELKLTISAQQSSVSVN